MCTYKEYKWHVGTSPHIILQVPHSTLTVSPWMCMGCRSRISIHCLAPEMPTKRV